MHKYIYPLAILAAAALSLGCSEKTQSMQPAPNGKSAPGKTAAETNPVPSSGAKGPGPKMPEASDPHGMAKGHPPMGGPLFQVPEGWTRIAASGMRYATLTTGEGAEKVDISITRLRGTAGGILMNVNRWRRQVGLEQPIAAAELNKVARKVKVKGSEAVVVDLKGPNARMLAAIVPRPSATWFFKLTATDALAGKHKTAFERVVHSLEFK